MLSSSDEVLEAAVAGIPEIARRIAFLPTENRASAFDAAFEVEQRKSGTVYNYPSGLHAGGLSFPTNPPCYDSLAALADSVLFCLKLTGP